ncbi:MAG: IgGFc-binding protein [Bacteroidetes bacterium]|nr:IgGFc-binding protein [Bacteroidota bacterium]
MKKIFFIVLGALLAVSPIRAQNTSGTDFWLTFGRVIIWDDPSFFSFRIRIVGGYEPTSVRIDFTHLGTHDVFNINPHQIYDYILDNTQKNAVYNKTTGITDYSIRITTQKPVTVYTMCGLANYCPVTNVLPVTAFGTEYYQISYLPTIVSGASGLDAYAVLATQNNTQVWHNGNLEATLNEGDVYYRTEYADMTGAHITTNHPVAFFAINQSADIPHNYIWPSGAGPLFQQLAPVNTWDKSFFVPVTEIEKDIVRVVVSKNGTNITQTGGTVRTGVPGAQTSLTNLQAGDFVELEIELSNNGCYIETNYPVGVCSYITYNINFGSVLTIPSQTWVPGINQSVITAQIAPVAFSGTAITHHYALIYTPSATKNNTKVSVGGATPTALSGGIWHDNAISGMSFYSMPLTNPNATYIFSNLEGVIIFGYGFNNTNAPASYYYLAYSAMRDLDAAFFANDIHFQDLEDNPICESEITFRAKIEGLHPTAADKIRWFIDGAEQYAEQNNISWSRTFSVGEYEIRMLVRYENNDTVSKTGTLKICSFDADFYVNEIHHSELPDITFCENEMYFRAEVEDWESLEWWIGGVEEVAARNQTTWDRVFPNGTYPVELRAFFANSDPVSVFSTLNVFKAWIKMRNIKRE